MEELLGGFVVPPTLDEKIEEVAVLIDRQTSGITGGSFHTSR